MPNPILQTKLYAPPPRPDLIQRPRLIEKLNNGIHRKLTLISAPAGFGKTTLVSDWLRQIDMPVAWLSLDEDDNDPIRFLSYLIAALQQIEPEIGRDMPSLLEAAQPLPLQSLITKLINDVVATSTRKIMVVLDDYHLIDAQSIHHALTSLLNYLPPQMHFIVTTRADPPWPLSRLRAQGQLTELKATDLRFTLAEAEAFLNQGMHLNLSAENIAALETRTEGWVAGLQLFALSLREREQDTWSAALSGRHRDIADYLAEEVLPRQPEPVQSFLAQTAILNRLNSNLCDAVTGQSDSHAMLISLERANLFIIPLDDERCWYRYHHLFADFLGHYLQRRFGQTEIIKLNERASLWYEENDFFLEAIHHAFKADDWVRTARLVEQVAPTLSANGQLSTLLRWLKELPEQVIQMRPRLCLEYSWALLITGEFEAPKPYLQAAEETLTTKSNPADETLLGILAAIRAAIASLTNRVEQAITFSQQALHYLPEDNLKWRATAATSLGLAHQRSGNLFAADQVLADACRFSAAIGNVQNTLLAIGKRGQVQTARGQLKQAAKTYQEAIDLTTNLNGHLAAMGGLAYLGLGELSYEWNKLEEATQFLLKAIELGQQWEPNGIPDILTSCYLTLAQVYQAQNDFEAAQNRLEQAREQARIAPFPDFSARLTVLQTRLWLAQGETSLALRWAKEIEERNVDVDAHEKLIEPIKIALIRVRLAHRKLNEANYRTIMTTLAKVHQVAESTGCLSSALEVLILQAFAYHVQGQSSPALKVLTKALTQAEPAGYIRLFVDEGALMTQLLLRLIKKQQQEHRPLPAPSPMYLRQLLAGLGVEMALDTPIEAGAKINAALDPLTDRELEVLELVAAGLSNRDIAQQLTLSLGTVKRHVSNINSKLQASSRTEAVALARASNLL
ncbi:LuxR C-terminal-related transcriptional regulator [Chloroflexi bacterium TSY]|nr:LuxR C-terminal-related transcriptional regulator [Chloroflexi bacterium TSY]